MYKVPHQSLYYHGRRMKPMAPNAYYPEPIFTLAGISSNHPPELLFYHPVNWPGLQSQEVKTNDYTRALAIADSPELLKIFNQPIGIFPCKNFTVVTTLSVPVRTTTSETSIALSVAENRALRCYIGNTQGKNTLLIRNNNQSEITEINLRQMWDACHSPLKYSMSCIECLTQATKTNPECAIATLCIPVATQDIPTGIIKFEGESKDKYSGECDWESLYSSWLGKKISIGEYTYINPCLTGPRFFPALRPFSQHDIGLIAYNEDIAKKAGQERHRKSQFKKNVCTKCFMQSTCGAPETYCSGAYPPTIKEASAQIVQNTVCSYTDKQIIWLLEHSGELTKRYQRYKYHATFYCNHRTNKPNQILFGLVRSAIGTRDVIPFENFKEAKKFLEEYGDITPTQLTHLTLEQKAILFELATKDYSPNRGGGWHKTRYPTLATIYQREFIQIYKGKGAQELYWKLHANNLNYIYSCFGTLSLISKNRDKLRKGTDW